MEEDIFSPGSMLGVPPDSVLDFDNTNELLLDGCWSQTANESEFLHHSPISSAFFDNLYLWSTSEVNNGNSSTVPSQTVTQEEEQRTCRFPSNEPREGTESQLCSIGGSSKQAEDNVVKESQLSEMGWSGPRGNPCPAYSVMERMYQALGYIRASAVDRDVLIQVWAPICRGGIHVLTTNYQPFSLAPSCPRLAGYRNISVKYQFGAEKDCNEALGLPGRVFVGKVPECTPDVRFFNRDEYPRVDYAQLYNVSGAFGLPVFEQGSRVCAAVIEVVTTTQKINYHHELESVCKVLEAVELRSSGASTAQKMEELNSSYEVTTHEILEILRSACVKHKLPLAQTWVPCIQQGKGGYWHSDENCLRCVSTLDSACFVTDPHVQSFHEVCSEHHLLKGQGIVGEAFMTNQPCFSHDTASLKKTEYPLSHHARVFGLHAAVAIRLRSIYTGSDFVLEFFLPVDCKDYEEQKKMLGSLSVILQQVSQSLRVITDKELAEEIGLLRSENVVPSDGGHTSYEMPKVDDTNVQMSSREESIWTTTLMQAQKNRDLVPLLQKGSPKEVLDEISFKSMALEQESNLKCSTPTGQKNSAFGEGSCSGFVKNGERRHTKAEKVITLEVLRQYFAGSLKDAAKSLGVCPTTLKRICRQHGITRWPSRKIKKVDHSLQKLQLVIDSVHGASGTFQIRSICSSIQELASAKRSETNLITASKHNDDPKLSTEPPQDEIYNKKGTTSNSPASPCSQSSSSSHCCSSGTQKLSSSCSTNSTIREYFGGTDLKTDRDEVELHRNQGQEALPSIKGSSFLNEEPAPELDNCGPAPLDGDSWRLKVSYGDEKIRLRMQNNWNFRDLLLEIQKRFRIEDMSRFHLKYLDDDSEWVLLTCDADLEECIDVCMSLHSDTIKLSLIDASHRHSSSLGSTGFL